MEITATETHRLGTKVHVEFTNADGVNLQGGGRYIEDSVWDDEDRRKRMIAEFSDEVEKRPIPVSQTASVVKTPVVLTAAEVDAELAAKEAEIQAIKDAEAAKITAEQAAKEAKAEVE